MEGMAKSKPPAKRVLLQMAVPPRNEQGPMGFEQILASLHGLLTGKTYHDESVSFEMMSHKGRVFFYLSVPEHLERYLSKQLYAQYPSLQLKKVKDYFKRSLIKNKQVTCASLKPDNLSMFPFKSHYRFVDPGGTFQDPLNSMTAAISQLENPTDAAVIQVIISPVPQQWNKKAEGIAKDLFRSGVWSWKWFRNLTETVVLDPDCDPPFFRAQWWKLWAWIAEFKKSTKSGEDGNDDEDKVGAKLEKQSADTGEYSSKSIAEVIYDKLAQLHYATNIRMCYIHSEEHKVKSDAQIREMVGTFQQFAQPGFNTLTVRRMEDGFDTKLFKRVVKREPKLPFAISQSELATIIHLPTETVTTPGICWVESRTLEPPAYLPGPHEESVTLIAKTNFRGQERTYGVKREDRMRHTYVIGKTGMGKSVLLENMARSDILNGHGVAIIDPHGDLIEDVIRHIPPHRINDVVYFDPSDRDFPIAFNLLEGKNVEHRGLIASGVVGAIKKLFADSWGPRLEYFLRNCILALVEAPDTTLLGVTRMLVDKAYRKKIVRHVTNPSVLQFWNEEFAAMQPRQISEAAGPIQNKIGQFLSTATIRNILGQPKSSVDVRFAMDTGKILLVNLSKGKIGEDNATLLGSLMITKIQMDAMSRADMNKKDRKDFYLYVDEFQNFATDSFATILSEARKYRLSLTMANQFVAQMSEDVAAAVFGNVGSIVSFQVGQDDAKYFEEQYDGNIVTAAEIASLPKYTVYNRIMVDGLTTQVFSGATLPPQSPGEPQEVKVRIQKIIDYSRSRYANPREKVEEKILRWSLSEHERNKLRSEENKKRLAEEAKANGGVVPEKKTDTKSDPKPAMTQPKKALESTPKKPIKKHAIAKPNPKLPQKSVKKSSEDTIKNHPTKEKNPLKNPLEFPKP